jgi:hypothetical protein
VVATELGDMAIGISTKNEPNPLPRSCAEAACAIHVSVHTRVAGHQPGLCTALLCFVWWCAVPACLRQSARQGEGT